MGVPFGTSRLAILMREGVIGRGMICLDLWFQMIHPESLQPTDRVPNFALRYCEIGLRLSNE